MLLLLLLLLFFGVFCLFVNFVWGFVVIFVVWLFLSKIYIWGGGGVSIDCNNLLLHLLWTLLLLLFVCFVFCFIHFFFLLSFLFILTQATTHCNDFSFHLLWKFCLLTYFTHCAYYCYCSTCVSLQFPSLIRQV